MSDHGLRVYDCMLDMIPGEDNPTPLVRLTRTVPFRHAKVYAKLEWFNPFGAVKDRVAWNLVRDAEARGLALRNLVEPTSGNTGMGLAMVANARGYGFAATISSAIPLEKRTALRLFGTQLVELTDALCPMPGAPEGAMARAAEMGELPGWHSLNQYRNPANPEAHFRTTGPEVWRQTGGTVTHFVASLGTCGTITGTGRFLKSRNPAVKVIGVHPGEGHDIPGVRSRRALAVTDFFLPAEYDGVLEIADDETYELNRRLIQEECVIGGPSCALALAGALRAVPDEPGVVAVVMFPDNAFKYLSSYRRHLPDLFPEPGADASAADPFAAHLQAVAAQAEASPDVIDAADAAARVAAGALLVDVRDAEESEALRPPGAVLLPLPSLVAGATRGLPDDLDVPLVTVCSAGKRSLYGMLILKARGHRRVTSVAGGLQAWTEAGYPVVTGPAG
jgi:cysteine synthase/rhodanese-related sulfurtransferase